METDNAFGTDIGRAIESEDPAAFAEAIEQASPEEMGTIMRQVSMAFMTGRNNPESQIAQKVSEEHISDYLRASEINMKKGFQERRETKIFVFALVVCGLFSFFLLISQLKDNPDLMEKVLYAVGGLITGAFGGYGFGSGKQKNN